MFNTLYTCVCSCKSSKPLGKRPIVFTIPCTFDYRLCLISLCKTCSTLTPRLQQRMYGMITHFCMQHVIKKEEGLPPQAFFSFFVCIALSESLSKCINIALYCLIPALFHTIYQVVNVLCSYFLSILQLGSSD